MSYLFRIGNRNLMFHYKTEKTRAYKQNNRNRFMAFLNNIKKVWDFNFYRGYIQQYHDAILTFHVWHLHLPCAKILSHLTVIGCKYSIK